MKRKGRATGKKGTSRTPSETPKNRSRSWEDRESRDMRRDDKRRESKSEDKLYGLNDFSWYNKYPDLAIGAGRIQFPYRPGMRMQVDLQGVEDTANSNAKFTFPGVMRLRWMPSFGQSTDVLSPISISAKELYARVRSAFSGSLDADAPDFVMYLGALDSIFSYISWLKRLYGILDYYSPQNYVTPDGLLAAMGFSVANITELRQNKATLWTNINTLIHMTAKFTMPAVMDLFKRHWWMNSNVYTDAPSANSQYYIFDQVGFYKFAMLNVPGVTPAVKAGGLQMVYRPAPVTGQVVQGLFEFGQSLITALAESDDGYLISGYFRRAFEGVPDFGTTLLNIDEPFNPVYVPEVLAQIENSMAVMGGSGDTTSTYFSGCDVTQSPSTNTINTAPKYTGGQGTLGPRFYRFYSGLPLSIRSDAPTVEDVFIATRLKANVGANGLINCGTEIPIKWDIFVKSVSGWSQDNLPTQLNISQGEVTADNVRDLVASLSSLAEMAQFDWAPIIPMVRLTGAATTPSAVEAYMSGDTHNLTLLTDTELANLHRVGLYSELNAFNV